MKAKKITNFVLFLIVIIVNYLAVLIPLGGLTTGEISDAFKILLTPIGLTFSIWGVIYITLFITIIRHLIKDYDTNKNEIEILGPYFIINCLGNIFWMLCWQYQFFKLSLLMMLVILYSLIKINDYDKDVSAIFKASFSIYFGWISVATLLNICVFLHLFGIIFGYFGTAVFFFIATAAAVYFGIIKDKPFYGFTVAWALLGNYIKHGFSLPLILSVLIVIAVVIVQIKKKNGCLLK